MKNWLLVGVVGLSIHASALAAESARALELGAPFADGMVLQRGRPVPVWGCAAPGEKVSVVFAGSRVAARADAEGKWRADLPPLVASKEGRELVVSAGGERRVLRDVLAGEVWLASGQSNMECAIWNATNMRFRDREGGLLVQYVSRPFVRFCEVSTERHAVRPRTRWERPARWQPIDRGNVVMGSRKGLSAVAYYFALELYATLDIPVGIVVAVKGASNIDAWTPRAGLATRPDLKDLLDFPVKEEIDPKLRRWPFSESANQPTVLWNSMLSPLVPMALRGAIWYQGEQNSTEPGRYASRMHALYDGWKAAFENPSLSFLFVQIPPWGDPGIAAIQEAQAKFADEEPNAGMAVVNDLGNLKDIHPNVKGPVGRRLAALALQRNYGYKDLVADAPKPMGWRQLDGGRVEMSFSHVKSWYVYNDDRSMATGFELRDADGRWHKAELANMGLWKNPKTGEVVQTGFIGESRLVVASPDVPQPTGVRYLHSAPWYGSLHAETSLPLGAFCLDLSK